MFPEHILDLADALVKNAAAAGLHVAFAESCTGGLMAAAVTEIAGASAAFDRGFVVYTNRAKRELLGVPAKILVRHGAVSEEVARAMAEGAIRHSRAQLAAACTGIAGPGGATPEKPVGLVYTHAVGPGGAERAGELNFPGDRATIRVRATVAALHLVRKLVANL
jgi:nicotinamide-nucleotide amidase